MTERAFPTHAFRRIEPARNMARFYIVSLEPTLFGEIAVVRHWGRIGTHGRRLSSLHASLEDACAALSAQIARRRRRGYVPAEGAA